MNTVNTVNTKRRKMNTEHRYKLDKSSKKYLCPDCGKKRFVRFMDIKTGEYAPEQYGRCDKGDGHYFVNPYADGYAKAIWEQEQGNRSELPKNWKPQRKKVIPQPTPEPVFFDFETFKQTLQPARYEKNTFIQNLLDRVQFPFEAGEVTRAIELYRLGTVANGYRAGANTFPFIDSKDNVRAIQVKQFDKQNHTTSTDFLHSIIEKFHTRNNKPLPEWLEVYTKQDKRISCLFGEHLLSKYPNNPVALVEAPKTAVYGLLYFGLPETPQSIIWLAVYNKSSFSFDKLKALKGRYVYVFPDLSNDGNTFKEWEAKAKDYESRLQGTRFIFSDLLERLTSNEQKEQGADIADVLIKLNWRQFRQQKKTDVFRAVKKETPKLEHLHKFEVFNPEQIEQSINWKNDITELETYFTRIELPKHHTKLNKYSIIKDCSLFIESHFATIKRNNGNRTFLPHLNRLQELKQLLTINSN